MQAELIHSIDTLPRRVTEHLVPRELIEKHRYPTDRDLEEREGYRLDSPGADFCWVRFGGKSYIVPPWSDWNRSSNDSKSGDYARAWFEGGSLRPNLRRKDEGNIILHQPKMERFIVSGKALGYTVTSDDVSQAVYDLTTILGSKIMVTSEGVPSRAYIRPRGKVGRNGWGVAAKDNDPIEKGAIAFNWPYYFKDPERIYGVDGSGLNTTIFLDQQRASQIKGKISANYPIVGGVSQIAREIYGDDDAIILAPHRYDPATGKRVITLAQEGETALLRLHESADFADGPGEGVIAVKGRELWIPPMSVNQLPSTTMAYIAKYLAPALGFTVVEKPFGFYELRGGEIDNVFMVGNAALMAPVGQFRVIHPQKGQVELIKRDISQAARELVLQYMAELDGVRDASHESLLTPVYPNSQEAQKAKQILYNHYEPYFR